MRPITELVDEFIEELFNGSVITALQKDINLKDASLPMIFLGGEKASAGLATILNRFWELMPQYRSAPAEQKAELANKLFDVIIWLRSVGVFQNNPNVLKELEFYKAKSASQEEELHKKGVLITQLYNQLEGKKVPPDKKELKF